MEENVPKGSASGNAKASNQELLKTAYDSRYHKAIEGMKIGKIHEKHDYPKFLNMMKTKKGPKVLDVGCGYGNFLKVCEERDLVSYGIDISSIPLTKVARLQLANSQLLVSDAENLPFKDGCFDHIACLETLKHFLKPQIGVKEIARVMKVDGSGLLTISNSFFLIIFGWSGVKVLRQLKENNLSQNNITLGKSGKI